MNDFFKSLEKGFCLFYAPNDALAVGQAIDYCRTHSLTFDNVKILRKKDCVMVVKR